MLKNSEKTMEQILALCKNRGFVFPGSEIYGGLSNAWDYGPLGVELKKNIKNAWWQKFVQESPYNVGLDAAILMNTKVWEASGHIGGFSDPLMDCKDCKTRHRADHLIEAAGANPGGWTNDEMQAYIQKEGIVCPNCGSKNFTDIRQFNLMFKTFQGVTEDNQSELFLRPETAQGIFVNFASVQRVTRKKMPFGIAQIGKSFRNEITPGNFIFRTREFEQMELEFFCKPGEDDEWHAFWKAYTRQWLLNLGMNEENVRYIDHAKEALSHYSKATTDIEYLYPFGWGELWGIANRTNYDLTQHQNGSGKALDYFDPETSERYVPYTIEPSVGVERALLAFVCDAYDEEKIEDEIRTVMHFHPAIAPFKAAVLPLSKKLSKQALEVHASLAKYFMVDYDETGSIGKRYRRQDEIGTPYCITYDFDSADSGEVTVRDRDSMKQIHLKIDELRVFLEEKMQF